MDSGLDPEVLSGKPAFGFIPKSLPLRMTSVYIGLFIIRPWEIMFPQLSAIHFERLCGILVVVCVALTCGFRLRWNLQNAAVATLVFAVGVSALLAYDPAEAWDAAYRFFTVVVCYSVLVSVIRTPYDLLFIVGAYIGFMELYLGKALWEYFVYDRSHYTMGVTRLIGIEATFGHPNDLAASIVVSLPIWWFLWRCRREIMAEWPSTWRKTLKWGLAAYAVLASVSIILTNSRTGMIALGIFVFLAAGTSGSKRRLFQTSILTVLFVGIGWLAMPEEQKDRLRTIWDPSINESANASSEGRFVAIRAAIEIFQRFPLIGVGPGNFISYRENCVDGIHLEPHNLLGQMLAETGLLGAAAFVFLVMTLLINSSRTRAAAIGQSNTTLMVLEGLAVACRNSIILLLVEGMTGHNFYRFNWLWMAAFCSLAAKYAAENVSQRLRRKLS